MTRQLALIALWFPTLLWGQAPESIIKAPETWNSEIISFPLSFAPEIQLEGFEDIRFAPGWSDPSSGQFWTYHFTWVLEKPIELDASYLERTLTIYFDGLAKTVAGQMPDTSVAEKSVKPISQFQQTVIGFTGIVRVFDPFHTLDMITLNVKVRERNCTASGKQLISFELSPKSFDHHVWNIFRDIETIIACN